MVNDMIGNDPKIFDISMTLENNMACYPKDIPYHWQRQRDMNCDCGSNVSQFESSCHIGTHVDSPLHYYNDSYDVASIPLTHLYGKAYVIDCLGTDAVGREDLAGKVPEGTKRLLLKTDNSKALAKNPRAPFNPSFVYLDATGAEFCREFGIIMVGIDYLSIDQSGLASKPAHHTLLGNDITILEGILLDHVPQGEYFIACGSLKMAQSDGAPARTVLFELEN